MLTQKHLLWIGKELGLTLESSERVSHYRRSTSEWIHQWARHIAYWTLRKGGPWASALSRVSSSFRKAEKWECAPQLDVTRDHVVAVFRKRGDRELFRAYSTHKKSLLGPKIPNDSTDCSNIRYLDLTPLQPF